MKQLILLITAAISIFLIASVGIIFSSRDWVRLTNDSGITPRDSAGEIVFNGKAWLIGGYAYGNNLNDIVSTTDFINWEYVGDSPCEGSVSHPLVFKINGEVYLDCAGKKLFKTKDFKKWLLVSSELPWKNYYGTCVTVYKNRALVFSGTKAGAENISIFSSSDGVNWNTTEVKDISSRGCHSSFFTFENRVYFYGGRDPVDSKKGLDEAWVSTDGVNFKKVGAVHWRPRIWETFLVADKFVMMTGGYYYDGDHKNISDTWITFNGTDWTEITAGSSKWIARHEASMYYFNNNVYMVAGNAYPLQNDVWKMPFMYLVKTQLVSLFN